MFQRVYADTFKIFYDPFGGDRFGAIWDPSVKQPRPFRVLGGFSSTPVKKVLSTLSSVLNGSIQQRNRKMSKTRVKNWSC